MAPKKLKKPPKNAYYFYMIMRKEQLERQGYRFPGGMKEVASSVAGEWADMSPIEKAPFEEQSKLAKEEGKSDLSNKFTVTGESYAQMQRRIMEEKSNAEEMEHYITELGMGEGALDRYFILIKTIHCVEQILEKNNRHYWPLEIGLCAFSLREGLRSIHWTLVDTVRTPVGYASAAKETSEETGLPEPGSKIMEEFRDYHKILKSIKGFIEFWSKKGYRRGPVVFAMEQETDHARGCLQWLVNHLEVNDDDVRRDYDLFLSNLKIYKLPKLILRLADFANQINPAYENVMTTYKLEHTAASIVNKGCYDYRDEITCNFHRREDASLKMYTCCRNVVLRRMYLMFEEFLPAFGIVRAERHDIDSLGKASAAKAKSVVAKAVAASHPDSIRKESSASTSSSSISTASSWIRSKPEPHETDYPAAVHVPTVSSSTSKAVRRRDFDRRCTETAAPSSSSYVPGDEEGYVPWGRKRDGPSASFEDDDFPALGALPSNPSGGRGTGRGRGIIKREDDDDIMPGTGRFYDY